VCVRGSGHRLPGTSELQQTQDAGRGKGQWSGKWEGEPSWLDPGKEGGSQGSSKTKPPLPHTPPSPRSFPGW